MASEDCQDGQPRRARSMSPCGNRRLEQEAEQRRQVPSLVTTLKRKWWNLQKFFVRCCEKTELFMTNMVGPSGIKPNRTIWYQAQLGQSCSSGWLAGTRPPGIPRAYKLLEATYQWLHQGSRTTHRPHTEYWVHQAERECKCPQRGIQTRATGYIIEGQVDGRLLAQVPHPQDSPVPGTGPPKPPIRRAYILWQLMDR